MSTDILIQEYLKDLNIDNNIEFLNEDFKSFIHSISLQKLKQAAENLKSSIEDEGIDKAQKIINSLHIPKMSMGKIEDTFQKINPEFKKFYLISKQVIKNSIDDIPESLIDPISAAITFKSTYKSDNPLQDTKDELKEFVNKYHSVKNSFEDKGSSILDKVFKILIFLMASFLITVLLSVYGGPIMGCAIILCVGYMFAMISGALSQASE